MNDYWKHLHWKHLHKLGSIYENYTFTGISGMNSDKEIFRGRPYGGTAILYKKQLAKYVTSCPCQSGRISAVKVVMENNFSYVRSTFNLFALR